MTPRLTIVLPLKGRYLFTLRFLWYANREKFPYRILIPDGQVQPALAQLFEDSRTIFPSLDIEYVRYPDDATFSLWFVKMSDALQRVRTSYTMIADNDDFLALTGIERSLDFLDSNPDYVCCGGGVGGFSVYSGLSDPNGGLVGPFNRFLYPYTAYDRSADFSSPSTVDRLRKGSRYWWPYYAVFRTNALRTIWSESKDIDFSDLQLHELFFVMRTLTLGKAYSDGSSIAYLRQKGSPRLTPAFSKDWVHHLFRSRFTSDFAAMIDRISITAAAADGVDRAEVAEMLRAICEQWLREFLRVNYGEVQTLKQLLRDNAPGLVRWLKNRRRYFVGRERAAVFSKLASDGASQDYLMKFRDELEAIEDVLTGTNFAEFLRAYIPVLGESGATAAVSATALRQAAE